MSREDIERMAREAGVLSGYESELFQRFAHLVYESVFRDANIAASRTILDAAVLEEREACAKVCDFEVARLTAIDEPRPALAVGICAAAIRERSNP